jgi:4-cresol dehydrogenase (hydroxylating) flavoprotein subunit
MKTEIESALTEWKSQLGEGRCLRQPDQLVSYLQNVSALKRVIHAVLLPETTQEVQQIVLVANRYSTPLYPISVGKNWGYGSRLPAGESAVLVDLSRMNKIRNQIEISEINPIAILEPGVTQGQLHRFVSEQKLPLVFNVTGAGPDTSLVGNALDRGCGYFQMRPEDVLGMEIVLGNGELLRTGFGGFADARAAHHYKYGLGPSLDGLFYQSNFGIVTSIAFKLHPKPETHATLLFKIGSAEFLEPFIDRIADLKRRKLIQSVPHIGNRNRTRSTLGPLLYEFEINSGRSPGPDLRAEVSRQIESLALGEWSGITGISGPRRVVNASIREIRKKIGRIADIQVLSRAGLDRLAALARWLPNGMGKKLRRGAAVLKPLIDFTSGIPSGVALDAPAWSLGLAGTRELDSSEVGLLFCCPALPSRGSEAMKVLDCVHPVTQEFQFEPFMTFNAVDEHSMLCILNIVFPRSSQEEADRAHHCIRKLHETLAAQRFYPYRTGIFSMIDIAAHLSGNQKSFCETNKRIKGALDPKGIIADKRYINT